MSWASPGQAERPRVRIGQRVIAAAERACPDTLSGAVTWTYHARVDGLRPGATYGYAVTADNDANAADPFSATFTTAPEGRAAFRFTSFGDLARARPSRGRAHTAPPLTRWARWRRSSRCSTCSTATSRRLPGPGALNPAARAQAWRDFGNNVQASAANRPWLPVPGGHELEPATASTELASYLTRYTLPPNGVDGLEGRWYAFRVGTALFVCLSGDDVACSGGGGVRGAARRRWRPPAGGRAPAAGTPGRCAATRAARRPGGLSRPWRPRAATPRSTGSSSSSTSAPARRRPPATAPTWASGEEWLPLFDTYEVDLVLSGHDHGYERSFPVRGFDAGRARTS